MSSKSQKPKTFNVKKCKKLEAKKRKLEAFLELVRKDEDTSILQGKKAGETFEENYKALKNELQKYKKKETSKPSFYLIDDGIKATVSLPLSNNYSKCSAPLFVEDLYHLLLKSVLGNLSPFPLRWCKLEQVQNIASTVLFVIDGLSVEDIIKTHDKLAQNNGIFSYVVEILSANVPIATELSTLHLASSFYSNAKEYYADLFPLCATLIEKSEISNTNVSKLHLLLNPIQLVMENFPMPSSVAEQSLNEHYVFSKDSYSPVTNNSPMFALDCEMCLTTSGKNEVTRIAVVDENLETVYHTLVKPHNRIINYLTKFSGITKEMMIGVTTTLEDVHSDLQRILPSDAILCGQSLNCDLHALKMIHPYVIDTSVIFNQRGVRKMKTSLKKLTNIYLKETIQNNTGGHNPIEDSIATMKLVQLKLEKSVQYGDVVLEKQDSNNVVDVNSTPHFSDYVMLNTNSMEAHDGLFSRISRFSKNICLIGSQEAIKDYNIKGSKVTQIFNSDTNGIINATFDNSKNFDLVISHLSTDKKSSDIELNNSIKQTYDNISNKTLFIVILSGIDKFGGNLKRSLCMVVLKNEL